MQKAPVLVSLAFVLALTAIVCSVAAFPFSEIFGWFNWGDSISGNIVNADSMDSGCYGSLLGYYDFDGNVLDSSPSQRNGILTSKTTTPSYPAAGGVKALSFPGKSDFYVTLPNTVLDGKSDFSVSLWFMSSGSQDGIFSVQNSKQPKEFLITNQESLSIFVKGTEIKTGIILNDNRWHYLAVMVKGSEGRAYVSFDGYLMADAFEVPAGAIKAEGIVVGQFPTGVLKFDSKRPFAGQLDELAVFNRIISMEDITNIFIRGYAGRSHQAMLSHAPKPMPAAAGTATIPIWLAAQPKP